MSEIVKYLMFVAAITVITWICAKLFADSISDYEVITPKKGVECVVVSRAFNTSVDCWSAKDE